MSTSSFGEALRRVAVGEFLSADEAAGAFDAIMRGEVSEPRMAAFLTALAMRPPAVAEITGAVRAMRAAMTAVRAPEGAIDVCGTGGDGLATLNVSTATAFVVAGCGVPVAKHGNRSISSRTGTADVLERLGVSTSLDAQQAETCLAETGFCFLFAPKFHPAMRHIASVRRELGFRTIFNLIGPLSNPAGVRRQLIGVYSRDWLEPLAQVLRDLETQSAWLVHSTDGMDEISGAAATEAVTLRNGQIAHVMLAPEDAGLPRCPASAIAGGDAHENAAEIEQLLGGKRSAFRNVVVLNAAAALIVAGNAADLSSGVAMAAEALDSGCANDVLRRVQNVSSGASQ
jgi:anthranilate phosphoribosyltransferase